MDEGVVRNVVHKELARIYWTRGDLTKQFTGFDVTTLPW